MIILIDNYDSFTYNLFQYMTELGAKVKVFRNDEIKISEIEKNLTIPNSEENITNTLDTSNVNILSEEEFQRFSILRDQELETHFQHLKIETTEE